MPQIEINGAKLHYEERGKGDPIVMVHGLGGSIFDWVMQIPFFSKAYRAIAVEMRDHGKSGKWKGSYDIKMFSDDVAGFIQKLELGKTILFGVSMGGMITMQLELDHPDLVKALVLADTQYGLTEETIKAGLEMASMSQKMSGKELAMATMKFNFSPEFIRSHPEIVEEAIKVSDARDPSSTFRGAQGLASFNVKNRLKEIRTPTLIANGEDDPVVPVSMAKYLKENIRGAKLVILRKGRHMAIIEKASEFNDAAIDFLKGIEKR
ncbi:MAG: alpha/beta hydrolase [Promethearchaeati archaeon SRVP18_Atabeyarchaeia-1]